MNDREKKEYNKNVEYEKSRRSILNRIYLAMGYDVVNRKAERSHDLKIRKDDKIYTVEEKIGRHFYRKYIWLELIECVVKPIWGWFIYCRVDFLSFAMFEDNEVIVYLFDFAPFRMWIWGKIRNEKMKYTQIGWAPQGKGLTLNLKIPWGDIPPELYEKVHYRIK